MDADVDLEGSVITGVSAYLETCTISKFPATYERSFFLTGFPYQKWALMAFLPP